MQSERAIAEHIRDKIHAGMLKKKVRRMSQQQHEDLERVGRRLR